MDETANNSYRKRTVAEEMRRIVGQLSHKYGAGEAKAMGRIIFENLKGWTPVDLAIRANDVVSAFISVKIDVVVGRLLNDEPIQYIFGVADFYGMKFKVTNDTLIPRPETAELVDMIVGENRNKDLRVLDCGTGSGCIAIALARNLPFADVTGVDISVRALDVAKENAAKLRAQVTFVEADMLRLADCNVLGTEYDIIVSNPPYIAESEREAMENNVLLHEPQSALFVPDSDPLMFYEALAVFARHSLSPAGRLYFEINPRFADDLKHRLLAHGFSRVSLSRDSFGKMRFLTASL